MSNFLTVLFLLVAIAATYTPASATPSSYLSVAVTDSHGQALASIPVTAVHENTLIALSTDQNGMVNLDNLAAGDWAVTACGQTVTYTSMDGQDIGGTLMLTCHRMLLPVVSR